MKTERQKAILELISIENIDTQEELAYRLKKSGYKVTQATVSRDIKDLHLIKVQSPNGTYKYAINTEDKSFVDVKLRIFRDVVKSVDIAGHLVVIKTFTGSANVAAETLDSIEFPGVVGSIAGDNTIFVALKSVDCAEKFVEEINKILL